MEKGPRYNVTTLQQTCLFFISWFHCKQFEVTFLYYECFIIRGNLKKIMGCIVACVAAAQKKQASTSNSLNNITFLFHKTNSLFFIFFCLLIKKNYIHLYLFTPAHCLSLSSSRTQREERMKMTLLVSVSIFNVYCKHLHTCISYQHCMFELCCPGEEKFSKMTNTFKILLLLISKQLNVDVPTNPS